MKILKTALVIIGVMVALTGTMLAITAFYTAQAIISSGDFMPIGIALLFFKVAFLFFLALWITLFAVRWMFRNRDNIEDGLDELIK